MSSIVDKLLAGSFIALLKLFKLKKETETPNMTAVVSRPGVAGATRYMIGENLVFFHHFETMPGRYCKKEKRWLYSDGNPKYTMAYFFPEDGTMMMAFTTRNPIDAYDRRLGNDIAFDRLLDGIRKPKDEEAQSHFYTVSFDEEFKGMLQEEIVSSLKYLMGAKTRDEAADMLMDMACERKFRSVSHDMIREFVSGYFYKARQKALDAKLAEAGAYSDADLEDEGPVIELRF